MIAWMSRSRRDKVWHKRNLERYKAGECDLVLRYGNSPNTDFSKILGGYNEITENTDTIIVVEGIMDKVNVDSKLGLLDNDLMKCVFTFGNKISIEQMKLINKHKNITIIYLLYDYGTIRESKHNGLMMLDNSNCKDVRVCEIKQEDKDPGDLSVDELVEVLGNSIGSFEFNCSVVDGIE